MDEETKKKYELKKQLEVLRNMKGTGTELISVYMPPGYAVHEVANKLREEAGQASNIKSKSTRKNVTDALERILQHLKLYRQAPESGMAIFCGNVSENPARTDIELYTVFPHEKINVQMYRCDSRFFLEPLERILDVKESYGLLVMDGREATLAVLRGTNVQIVRKLNSTAHAKIRKGGQSANRYARLIEESIELYYKRIGDQIDKYFLTGLKGVIVGGPGPAKDDFLKMKPFNYQIKIMGVVDTGYTDEYGVRELMAKSGDIIAGQEAVKERALVERFIKEVVSGGLATYGEAAVRDALSIKKAQMLLVSEDLPYERVTYACQRCATQTIVNMKKSEEKKPMCPSCTTQSAADVKKEDSTLKEITRENLADNLIALAESTGAKVEVISSNTAEGSQFLQMFYGVGAFLRYK